MPRIADKFTGAAIQVFSPAAKDSRLAGGSGAIVSVPAVSRHVAITNAHVVEAGGLGIRLLTRRGFEDVSPDRLEWHTADDGSDVSVAVLPERVDPVAAIPLDDLVDAGELVALEPRGHWPWLLPWGPGEDTFTITRLIDDTGLSHDFPMVRFGNLSSLGTINLRQRRLSGHRRQESLLVETRSLSGSSGSPVFAYRANTLYDGATGTVHDALLIGIDWGHIKHPVDAHLEEALEAFSPGAPTPGRYNSGLMAVVPAWTVRQVIEEFVAPSR